ncbi:hypothetical protein LPJ61_002007 [Coemansia biformis]|uniref:Uncharacterized protein n=1 Tax=Coemansia biformis TaxID=1286918 RepID=A0A9W7YFC6_9FUNG|nr:hypothetical protein LPJ61_002007 [Coemansia biformis]
MSTSASSSSASMPTLRAAGIDTRRFSSEPLLLRLDVATHAFYQGLADSRDRKMMELAASTANVNVLTRPAGKKEFKKYNQPGEDETTRNVRLKYQLREDNLAQMGAFDPQWGLRWLFSYVALTDMPGIGSDGAGRFVDLVERWLEALAAAGIHEIADELPGLRQTIAAARDELPCALSVSEKLPGRFNAACSLLFAGALRTTYVDAHQPRWVLRLRARDGAPGTAAAAALPEGLGHEGAAPMSVADAQEYVSGIVAPDARCTSSGAVDLRVKGIGPAAEDSGLAQVRVRVFDRQAMEDKGDELVLRLEHDAAAELRVGFVIEATLHALDGDVHYIDLVTLVWPSYAPLDFVDLF